MSVWNNKGGVEVLKSNERVGMKFNGDLGQWVPILTKPSFPELPDDALELQYPYHYVVDGRLYNTPEKVEEDYDTITYWDNEAKEFWSRWEKKP